MRLNVAVPAAPPIQPSALIKGTFILHHVIPVQDGGNVELHDDNTNKQGNAMPRESRA